MSKGKAKEMIITATFIGQDGSLGYKTHKEYKLRLTHRVTIHGSDIRIEDTSGKNPAQPCEYSTMLTFLQNWENVKDVTPEEPKRDPKEIAINFLDFYKPGRSVHQLTNAHKFYKRKFDPMEVMKYFQNWSVEKNDRKYKNGVILTNNNTQGWKVKIWINDNSEYTFCSGSGGTDNPQDTQWQYFPETMSEFISDCLRYKDIELLFSKQAIKEIYG